MAKRDDFRQNVIAALAIATAIVIIALLCGGCAVKLMPFQQEVVAKIETHTVAIAVYYYMPYEEYEKRIKERWGEDVIKKSDLVTLETMEELGQMIPLAPILSAKGQPIYVMAYIGSGTVLSHDAEGHNYILSVRHLFAHDDNTYDNTIYLFRSGITDVSEGEVVAITEGKDFQDDYAVVKVNDPWWIPGLKIAEKEPSKGEPVIFTGSTGGTAFFTRFGFLTDFWQFFNRDDAGLLHLAHWSDFKFWTVYPGGSGDSGGSVNNTAGEIVTVMYCGVDIYGTNYIFGNPNKMIWDFLKENKLEHIAK